MKICEQTNKFNKDILPKMPQSVICSSPICSSYEEIVHDEVDTTTMTGVSVESANDANSLESILGKAHSYR